MSVLVASMLPFQEAEHFAVSQEQALKHGSFGQICSETGRKGRKRALFLLKMAQK